ncbi:hypothetical protein CSAL01_06711 [Colletotrichum salicis]|uniref:Uncharacterized protein n=1 Tax=Colletotrichum salicis TaxID=1209931 RepID=A0A135UZ40_9PEZI|nr:hypothetical protein CSAL01_06711 [Colletotrichum salicis]
MDQTPAAFPPPSLFPPPGHAQDFADGGIPSVTSQKASAFSDQRRPNFTGRSLISTVRQLTDLRVASVLEGYGLTILAPKKSPVCPRSGNQPKFARTAPVLFPPGLEVRAAAPFASGSQRPGLQTARPDPSISSDPHLVLP